MKNFDWKTSAELVGISAIVVSLIFLGLQLKQTQDIAVSEISASHHASLVELNNAIADHADVWARGNQGLELDQAEMVTYRSLLDNLGSQHRIQWRHDLVFGAGSTTTEDLEFAVFLHENSGARRTWSADREKFHASLRLVDSEFDGRRFSSLVVRALEKLDEQSD